MPRELIKINCRNKEFETVRSQSLSLSEAIRVAG